MESTRDVYVSQRIGFLGSGIMAQAIAEGLIRTGTVPAANIIASSPSQKSSAKWVGLGAKHTNNNVDIIEQSDVIFIAVKPHLMDEAINSWKIVGMPRFDPKLFISVVAGTTISTLEQKLGEITIYSRIVRVMPNTPMAVGAGCSVYSVGKSAAPEDLQLVKRLLSAGGICEEVPENLINAIGALAGSGPAFVYLMLEALSDGAVRVGVPRDLATRIAAQTVMGASKMVLSTGRHPGQLKDEVCSPGGTTIAGIHALERAGVRGGVMDAVEAAFKRCEEISQSK